MIGRLTGRILACTPGQVLLDVAGVGYEIQIPLSTFYVLASSNGQSVSLHVHTHVREDALQLFGFSDIEERRVFLQLISISGVGPKLALAILSGIGVDELRGAVYRRDLARLQKIPGVGKKTAERVLLELRDKMKIDDPPAPVAHAEAVGSGLDAPGIPVEAASALINLGYSPAVADRAVAAAMRDVGVTASLEEVLKRALSGLVR